MDHLVISGAGTVSGALNALLTDNRILLPVRLVAGNTSIVRPGLLVSLVVEGQARSLQPSRSSLAL